MSAGEPRRSIIREPRFEREAKAIQPSVRRMDEALEYVENRLSQDPRSGLESKVPGIWIAAVRCPAPGRIVRASIFYTFEPGFVRFQSIKVEP